MVRPIAINIIVLLAKNTKPRSKLDAISQSHNQELSAKLAQRPIMTVGLERNLLECHLRLLLGKLGESNHAPGRGGGLLFCIALSSCA